MTTASPPLWIVASTMMGRTVHAAASSLDDTPCPVLLSALERLPSAPPPLPMPMPLPVLLLLPRRDVEFPEGKQKRRVAWFPKAPLLECCPLKPRPKESCRDPLPSNITLFRPEVEKSPLFVPNRATRDDAVEEKEEDEEELLAGCASLGGKRASTSAQPQPPRLP